MDYLVNTRRELHKIPEIGFDLGKTLAFVRTELDRMGVPYTEKYGKSSIVAYLGKRDAGRTIAIRADMDALPISEANDIPYKSLHEGAMHACGHDAHTAIALDTVRRLKELEDTLADSDSILEMQRFLDKLSVSEAIATLPSDWRKIITLRYFRNMTQQQVAEHLGITQVKVSREEKKILEELRKRLSV